MSDSHRFTAAQASESMAAGRLSAVRLAEDCLARIGQRERDVGAWAYVDPRQVLEQAMACDRQARRSPLHGIPVGVKDIIDTADMPTEYGSPIYAGHRPRADAACVALLRSAGAVIAGKTVTTEFAMRGSGKTRNPLDLARTPGGSSSGSAAAVADFMAPLALATQTSGSIIRPAAYCGVVGFKPTYNLISRAGVKPNADSLDTVGLMGRSVPDVMLVLQVLTGRRGVEPGGAIGAAAGSAPRVGFCRTPQWLQADDATRAALEGVVPVLARAGARVAEVDLPASFDRLLDAQQAISDFESSRALGHERRSFAALISATLAAKLAEADHRTFDEYVQARNLAADCRMLMRQVFADHDILVVPATTGEAPVGLGSTGNAVFGRLWTALHLPAVTVPGLDGPAGLPIGLQVVGGYGSDFRTLGFADWVCRALS